MSDQGYPPYPPPQPAPPVPDRRDGIADLIDRLGVRAARRPQPRLAVALAAAGVGLFIAGALVWGGERTFESALDVLFGGEGDADKALGVFLSLVVVGAGYATLVMLKEGPAANAGAVAAGLGVPSLLFFLTLDVTSSSPVNVDLLFLGTAAAAVATYVWVPGAQGRTWFLGLGAFSAWFYLSGKVAGLFPPYSEAPDATAFGVVSLIFGAGYYIAALALERRGAAGMALAFVVTGFFATAGGVAGMSQDLKEVGTGLLLMVLGLVLGGYGAMAGRRFTTWVWAAGFGLGVLVIVGWIFSRSDDPSAAGLGATMMAIGACVVGVAHFLAPAVGEPDELDPGPSTFHAPAPPAPPPTPGPPGHPVDYPGYPPSYPPG